ncbi:MAG: UPF0182 family protein [Candidatus Woesearchaeota archaeon]
MGGKANVLKYSALILVLLLLFFTGTISRIFTDLLWFRNIGLESVFTIEIFSRIGLLVSGALLFFAIVASNLYLAKKNHSESKSAFYPMLAVLGFFSLMAGLVVSESWLDILRFFSMEEFGIIDPIFNKDASFYVFVVPFLNVLWSFLFGAFFISMVMTSLFYLKSYLSTMFNQEIDPNTGMVNVNVASKKPKLKRYMLNHLGVLLSLIFILLGARHYISRYAVMYSPMGLVTGAGYTDANILIPVMTIMMVFALVVGVALLLYLFVIPGKSKVRKRHIMLGVVILYLVFLMLGQGAIPAVYQSLAVEPNEFTLEKEYLSHNINFTRMAYGLDKVKEIPYLPGNMSMDSIEESRATIDNARVVDYRPVTDTYKQTQEIRLYYDLSNLDIDRYTIDDDYIQTVVAPRELDQEQLTSTAKTWVNQKLVFTHGFGLVMSPVNKVDEEGLPDYIIQDVPPSYEMEDDNIRMSNPRIYYGHKTENYVVTNTDTPEFDYPVSGENAFHSYEGEGGIVLDSLFKRLMTAIRFGDIQMLFSSEINEDSRLMFYRNVQERIKRVAPFLNLDGDPYMVISDGTLKWIQDAYTTTPFFPYSERTGDINYMRNSVKIVLDAYEGKMDFYIAEPDDPIVNTYANIFEDLFTDMEEMPESLRDHVRYPEDLFAIQSQKMKTYHMESPNAFYNKEDAWERPTEIYGRGREMIMEPYYMIMSLPGINKDQEFVMMTPFTPERRNNMISWLAGRSDGEDYGELVLYSLPKDKLYYGPLQVEARIDQNPEISEQLTLWDQQGSTVIRGNMLVIPLEDSFLYVEPLYIQADSGRIPEMRRVIISDGRGVAMGLDLEDALQRLLVEEEIGVLPEVIEDVPEDVMEDIGVGGKDLEEASDHYDAIMDAMRDGDWEKFGEDFNELGEILG